MFFVFFAANLLLFPQTAKEIDENLYVK